MKFLKDLLIIDFEATGAQPSIDQPIQLAAILLDKETLQEKKSFSTKIKADLSITTDDEVKEIISGFSQTDLDAAPTKAETAKMFVDTFGLNDYLLSAWVMNLDDRYMEKVLTEGGYNFDELDYHKMDLFPIVYTYLVKSGYTGGIRTKNIYSYFGVERGAQHDALEDCRISAEILRKVMLA